MNILIISISFNGLINTRKEVIQAILSEGHEVTIAARYDEGLDVLKNMGANCIITDIDRRGSNPLRDSILILKYIRLMRVVKPDVVLSYTVKPNLYGGFACRLFKIPQIVNITGLGSAVENEGILKKIVIQLYRLGLKKATKVFFQNTSNKDFCLNNGLIVSTSETIPGSGVNLDKYKYQDYPTDHVVKFLYVGRLMKDKGCNELFEAAQLITQEFHDVEFHVVGGCESEYEQRFNQLKASNIFIHHGVQKNLIPYYTDCSCLIHPSYHEGMSNVCLEAAATGRPIITTEASGCRETVDDGISGFTIKIHSSSDLVSKIKKFMSLTYVERKEMGIRGRKKMEQEFDRQIVVNAYLNEINKVKQKIYNL